MPQSPHLYGLCEHTDPLHVPLSSKLALLVGMTETTNTVPLQYAELDQVHPHDLEQRCVHRPDRHQCVR